MMKKIINKSSQIISFLANLSTIFGFGLLLYLTIFQLPIIRNEFENFKKESNVIPNISYNTSEKIFQFNVTNHSPYSSKNLFARLFFEQTISKVSFKNERRVELIEGGVGNNFITIRYPELIFGESQNLYVEAGGDSFKDGEAIIWSDTEGDITNRFQRIDGNVYWTIGPEYQYNEKTGKGELSQ